MHHFSKQDTKFCSCDNHKNLHYYGYDIHPKNADLILERFSRLRKLKTKWKHRHLSELKIFAKINCIYQWLDPKEKGYINIKECCNWISLLWELREKNKMQDNTKNGTDELNMYNILNFTSRSSNCSILDLLISILKDSIWLKNSDNQIERYSFIWVLYNCLKDKSKTSLNEILWISILKSNDPDLNPIMRTSGKVLPPPDITLFNFYSHSIEEFELPETLKVFNEVDIELCERKKANVDSAKKKKIMRYLNSKMIESQSFVSMEELKNCKYIIKVEPELSVFKGRNIDEAIRFNFPALDNTVLKRSDTHI